MQEVRLIDANALIDKLDIMISKSILADTAVHYALIRELVAEQPTIEAEPVRRGKGCEYCKGRAFTNKPLTVTTRTMKRVQVVFNFCPKCGRKMNGGADNG